MEVHTETKIDETKIQDLTVQVAEPAELNGTITNNLESLESSLLANHSNGHQRSTEVLSLSSNHTGESSQDLPESVRALMEKADLLFQRLSTNTSLLDKLKKDLIEAKLKYTQAQSELVTAENDGAKLRKLKESESLNFGEIVADLVSAIFETRSENGKVEEKEAIQTFSGLLEKVESAVEKGHDFKIEFTFMSDQGQSNTKIGGQALKLKPLTGEKFEKKWYKLSSFFSGLKEPVSLESLKKNPGQVECSEQDVQKLEKEILPLGKSNLEKGKKLLKSFLKQKFLPMSLRPRLWKSFLPNPAGINKKLYSCHKKSVETLSCGLGQFGSESVIRSFVGNSVKTLGIHVAPEGVESAVRVLQVFELMHPDIGFLPGIEKLVLLLRHLIGIDEDNAFVLMYNIYFSSDLLWAILTCDPTAIQQQLNSMASVLLTFSECAEMYKINKQAFDRFFLQSALGLFVGTFSPDISEKIIDCYTVIGDLAFFGVMIPVLRAFGNFDLRGTDPDQAVEYILKSTREILDVEMTQSLITIMNNRSQIEDVVKKTKEVGAAQSAQQQAKGLPVQK
jgi:Rab-GTPase-TBC domain